MRRRFFIFLRGQLVPNRFHPYYSDYKDFMLKAESFLQAVSYLMERDCLCWCLWLFCPFIGFITGNNAASRV